MKLTETNVKKLSAVSLVSLSIWIILVLLIVYEANGLYGLYQQLAAQNNAVAALHIVRLDKTGLTDAAQTYTGNQVYQPASLNIQNPFGKNLDAIPFPPASTPSVTPTPVATPSSTPTVAQ